MKNLISILFLLTFSTICIYSCNSEALFVEPINEVVLENNESSETEDIEQVVDVTLPCDFNLNDVKPNATIIINCVLDLGGMTVNLPENVTLLHEGGDIVNGTLNFSEGSTFDGAFLSSTLTITGVNPVVKDSSFKFDPKRWGIVEGVVATDVALNNRNIFEDVMFKVQSFGISTFEIDEMDAYFKVDETTGHPVPAIGAINIPSNFHLKMTNNTHLRMQPNAYKRPTLLAVYEVENVIIEGGYLHGDRDTHDYSSGGTHEWGHCLRIGASQNIEVKDMMIIDAAGDGIDVHANNHSFGASYNPSRNVLIINNTIVRSRRNGISITDGRDIIVEQNKFIDTGINTEFSKGADPRWAIDIEAVRGNGLIYEIAEDIIIKNNIEKGSARGAFLVHTGDRVTIEENQTENAISLGNTIGSIIRNNSITAPEGSIANTNGTGIVAGRGDRGTANYNNKVYGNHINNFAKGIIATNTDLEVYSNTITNCIAALGTYDITNSKIHDNIINSTRGNSAGILSSAGSKFIDNVDIYNNTINVTGAPIKFVNQNINTDYQFTIRANTMTSIKTSTFATARGFKFENNSIKSGGIHFYDAKNGVIKNNEISKIIRLDALNENLSFIDNTIIDGCFWNNNTDAKNITLTNNNCDQ